MSILNSDWRKRVVFQAELAPSSINRFDCQIERWRPLRLQARLGARFNIDLLDEYAADVSRLKPNAFVPLVMKDNENLWRMDNHAFNQEIARSL
ncbi:hypothetical protein WMW72_11725 [Paenibacillus filicis]|uniref:Uncharacterized protein n=1 Tax=Paenibacillus filicis TaxID=669464 RepID=A0ABU9DI87_9BACL